MTTKKPTKGYIFNTTDSQGVVLDYWIVAIAKEDEAREKIKSISRYEENHIHHVVELDEAKMSQWVDALYLFGDGRLNSDSIIKINLWFPPAQDALAEQTQ